MTVLADTALAADGRATALLALGPEAGMALAEAQGWAALMIEIEAVGEFKEWQSSTFAARLAD